MRQRHGPGGHFGLRHSGNVGSKFTWSRFRWLCSSRWVYDDLGLTGPVSSTDSAARESQTQLRMTGSHPLTAGLSGNVTVGTSAAAFHGACRAPPRWSRPRSGTRAGPRYLPTRRAQLANGLSAPARRVGFTPTRGRTPGTPMAGTCSGLPCDGPAITYRRSSRENPAARRFDYPRDSGIGHIGGIWKRHW